MKVIPLLWGAIEPVHTFNWGCTEIKSKKFLTAADPIGFFLKRKYLLSASTTFPLDPILFISKSKVIY
jgi:hypothetical protein